MTVPLKYYKPEEVVDNELYTTIETEVEVTLDMFHYIWPGYAPKKELADQIAKACGVSFSNSVRFEDIYGDIRIVDGCQIKEKTGVRCTMQGYKMNIDGTMQTSPPLSYEFNWESRAEEVFIGDELAIGTTVDGKKYVTKYYAEGNERRTELLRKKYIAELKRFPTQRAGTGVSLVIIKYLTGIPSSFKKPELQKAGMKLMFSQVIKSKKLQAAEAQAKVENIRNGGLTAQDINNSSQLLIGESVNASEDFNNYFERTEQSDNTEQPKPENTDQGFKTEPLKPVKPIKPETPKEEYERFCTENNISDMPDDWRGQLDPTLEQQNYSKESVDWAISEMKARL